MRSDLHVQSLKAILHSLLVSASLPTLSLANNKKVKAKGWRFLAVFVRKVRLTILSTSQ